MSEWCQNNIDEIIFSICGPNKVFVEAGGSLPVHQSNTYFLELNGWRGLAVEPRTDFNIAYQQIRPKTIIENYALVSDEYPKDTIEGDFSEIHIGGIYEHNNTFKPKQTVPCCTLTKLLKFHQLYNIDFLSLDVEGYEKEVLKGIDFNRFFIHIIVVENHCGFLNSQIEELKTYNPNYFQFLEEYNFKKVYTIDQHEFYFNLKTDYVFKI